MTRGERQSEKEGQGSRRTVMGPGLPSLFSEVCPSDPQRTHFLRHSRRRYLGPSS